MDSRRTPRTRTTDVHVLVCTALLLLTLAPLESCLAQTPAGRIEFKTFNRDYYVAERTFIADELAPCGCITSDPMKGLASELPNDHQPTEAGTDFAILHKAEELLFGLMHELFVICQCAAGMDTVETAQNTPTSDPANGYITDADAQAMVQRVRRILGLANKECCNPEKSSFDYTFVNEYLNFDEARKDAQERGGFVARVISRHDAVKAYNTLNSAMGYSPSIPVVDKGQFAWLGLQTHTSGQVWSWTSNSEEAGSFQNWGLNEPGTPDSTKCAGTSVTTNWPMGTRGQWNALDCSNSLPYLLGKEHESKDDSGSSSDYKTLIIVIAVLLGLFLIASLFIVIKRIVGDANGTNRASPRYRSSRRTNSRDGTHRRRSRTHPGTDGAAAAGETEMDERTPATADGGSAAHPPSQQRRRVRFPRGNDNSAGGRASQYQLADSTGDGGSSSGGGSSSRRQRVTSGGGDSAQASAHRREQEVPRPGDDGGSGSAAYPTPSQDMGAATTPAKKAAPGVDHHTPHHTSSKNDPQQQQVLAVERAKKLQQMRAQREAQKRAGDAKQGEASPHAQSPNGRLNSNDYDGGMGHQGSSSSVFQPPTPNRNGSDLSNNATPVRYPNAANQNVIGGGGTTVSPAERRAAAGAGDDPMAFLDDVSLTSSQQRTNGVAIGGGVGSQDGSFASVGASP